MCGPRLSVRARPGPANRRTVAQGQSCRLPLRRLLPNVLLDGLKMAAFDLAERKQWVVRPSWQSVEPPLVGDLLLPGSIVNVRQVCG